MKKIALYFILTLISSYSIGATFTVTTTADSGPGSLRQAVQDADNITGLDTIVFDNSINGQTINLTGGFITVIESLVIQGNGVGSTIINNNFAGVLIVQSSGISISINDCEFNGSDGSAIFVNANVSLFINRCLFEFCDNSSIGGGGAIQFQGGSTADSVVIIESTFVGNQAAANGGAIHFKQGTLVVRSSTFWSNISFANGGAIAVDNGKVEISNSTFYQNVAINGAAIYDDLMEPGSFLSNCTIATNNASSQGGGLHSGGISSTSNVSLYNCIIANNSSPSGADVYLNDTFLGSAQNNIVETCFNASSICPSWFSTADPLLIVGLGNNGGPTQTLALNSGSPAIDMGLATYQQYFDQRGELRCPISDIGAYEFNPGTNNVETLQVTECVQYTVPSGDETYSTSGIYQDTLPNSTGCDSILTIDLTIPVPASGIDSLTACDSLVWIDGITYFTDNNTATFNIIGGTINGCDSLVTLYLTVLQSMSGTDAQTACDSLVWIDGLTYFTDNNTATFNFTGGAANGCDSLVTLELTINAINPLVTQTGTLLTSDETGATYQWLNCPAMTTISGATNQSFTATTNGDYAVTLTKNGCTDTSTCYSVTGVGIIENNFGNELLIYPNPTDGNFSIDLGNNYQTTVITITDVNGRIIQTKSYTDSQLLDLKPEEPTGIYFLIIESERKKAVIRLIKE